jgi:endogenous inhibitor of DNA gyrase (YacG/DUF329 family)
MATRVVNCPVCGKPAPFDPSNPFRPFCSERCRLIDLGQWANESYRVPATEGPDNIPSDDLPKEPG